MNIVTALFKILFARALALRKRALIYIYNQESVKCKVKLRYQPQGGDCLPESKLLHNEDTFDRRGELYSKNYFCYPFPW